MAQRTLTLIRHGQYHLEASHPRAGRLTPLGKQQSRRVARRLAEYPIDAVHSSTAPRALETAELIAERLDGVPLRRSAVLLEALPTSFPGLSREQRKVVSAHRARAEKAFARYLRPTRARDRHELLVCHGNIIRFLLRRALGDAPGKWWRMEVMHAGVSVVVIPSDGPARLLALNDVGHLPRRMHTFM